MSEMSSMASNNMPSMPSVPLMSASPSFSCNSIGSIPDSESNSCTGRMLPPASTASPSPISTSAQWESGAKSPLQPSEPNSRTTGVMPAFNTAAIVVATTGRTPVRPEASVFRRSVISARTTSRSTGAPTPAACERMRERCNWARCSTDTYRFASAPKPVETPYTGSEDATSASMWARDVAIAASAESESCTCSPCRAIEMTSWAVMPRSLMITLFAIFR
ncbi:unannotated protein [freshwater metagenome]|uniref:Unannotated protein n=1 Tax=freshwater metagenome TaxID=449393 RepID=A0A6J6KRF8_9ZZZZ